MMPDKMNLHPIKVLASAYACGPNWGSEVGMGWNWVIALSNYCQLTVITEFGFKKDIEAVIDSLDLKYKPKFHFIDIGDNARELFWKQGDWRFYKFYKLWQKNAYQLAIDLTTLEPFDIVHQLNMIGYREPGYLCNLSLPKVWGPIGGHAQMPWRFMSLFGLRAAFYYSLRNIINDLQTRLSMRVINAMRNFDALIAATENDQRAINNIHYRTSVIINETGTKPFNHKNEKVIRNITCPLKLVWSGFLKGGKALPILLCALAQFPDKTLVTLDIIGDGPERKKWETMSFDLGVSDLCTWHGRVEHALALELMKESDVFIFTSLLEGTSTVVLEALSFGLPIICHDTCGFGTLVNSTCGIKVPVVSPEYSSKGFSDAMLQLAKDRALLHKLSEGAYEIAKEITWDKKAQQMVDIYRELLSMKAGKP